MLFSENGQTSSEKCFLKLFIGIYENKTTMTRTWQQVSSVIGYFLKHRPLHKSAQFGMLQQSKLPFGVFGTSCILSYWGIQNINSADFKFSCAIYKFQESKEVLEGWLILFLKVPACLCTAFAFLVFLKNYADCHQIQSSQPSSISDGGKTPLQISSKRDLCPPALFTEIPKHTCTHDMSTESYC